MRTDSCILRPDTDRPAAGFVSYRYRLLLAHRFDAPEQAEQIQARDPDQYIDEAGYPGHVSKKEIDQVQFENSNQAPVDSPDNNEGKCRIIHTFAHNDFLLIF